MAENGEPIIAMASESDTDKSKKQEIRKLYQDQINANRMVLETFIRTGDFAVEIGEKTCFDHSRSTAVIGAEQLYEMGITENNEILFSECHELGHLYEFYKDPEGYLRIIKEGDREDGLGGIYFRLYNCLMDIYVNSNTADRFPIYRSGNHFSETPKNIYKTKLFPHRNFSERPLCVQFSDFLLNLGMESGDDIVLSPEVKEIIDQGITYAGSHYQYDQFIDTFLRPVIGNKGAVWQATATQRKIVIDQTIRPIWEKLLQNDIQNKKNVHEFDGALTPGSLNPDDMKKAIGDALDKHKEKNLSPEEKERRERERQIADLANKEGLDEEQFKKFSEKYEKVQPVIAGLIELWKKLRAATITWDREREGHYKTGSNLSIKKVISEWPNIQQSPSDTPVMERVKYVEHKDYKPKNFRLRIVLDLSGSMGKDIELIQELAIALAASLASMNAEAKINDPENPSIICALDIVGFSDDVIPIIENNPEVTISQIMKAYSKIKTEGFTKDHTALERINSSIDEENVKAIQDGDLIDILVELTDGDTSNPEYSRQLVDQIESKGVVVGGIKFGEGPRLDKESDKPEEDKKAVEKAIERKGFEHIWNSQGKQRGYRIGKASDILETLEKILSKIIERAMES